jgi:alpha-1,6-mannosyltransferase
MTNRKALYTFLAIAFCLEAFFLTLFILQDLNAYVITFIWLFAIAFIVFCIAVKLTLDGYFDELPNLSWMIFGIAILFRLTIFWTVPTLSEDFFRYMLDGRAQVAGLSPYDYPPEAPQLNAIHDQYFPKINWKQFKTPYPPGAENVFHLLAKLSSGLFGFKFGILCFDILLVECLRRILKSEKRPPALLLLYAWHPLVVVEFAGSAHMDIIGMAMLCLSLMLFVRSQSALSGVTLAFAAMVKYLPLFAIPWMIKKGGWKFLLCGVVMLALLAVQFYTPDLRMLDGIRQYYQKWWFNDSLFSLLRSAFGSAEYARRFGIGFTVLVMLFCLIARFDVYRSLLYIFGTVLLFSPVVHPWYVCWVIPFLVFHQSRAWMFFTGWIAISYYIRHMFPVGPWNEPIWFKFVIYVPLYLIMLFDGGKALFRRKDATAAA